MINNLAGGALTAGGVRRWLGIVGGVLEERICYKRIVQINIKLLHVKIPASQKRKRKQAAHKSNQKQAFNKIANNPFRANS